MAKVMFTYMDSKYVKVTVKDDGTFDMRSDSSYSKGTSYGWSIEGRELAITNIISGRRYDPITHSVFTERFMSAYDEYISRLLEEGLLDG